MKDVSKSVLCLVPYLAKLCKSRASVRVQDWDNKSFRDKKLLERNRSDASLSNNYVNVCNFKVSLFLLLCFDAAFVHFDNFISARLKVMKAKGKKK